MTGPSVPNWISKAVIYTPGYGVVAPIVEWRATATQVVVRLEPTGPERRFRLDNLTEVGDKRYGSRRTRLAAPDDPDVVADRRRRILNSARGDVLLAVDQQRLRDSTDDIEAVTAKLLAVQAAVSKALARIAEVL